MASGFDRLAPIYDWMLRLSSGRLLPRVRRSLLAKLPVCERALIPGEGTGEFLCDLMRAGRAKRATVIDLAPAMLARARTRAARELDADAYAALEFRVAALPEAGQAIERGAYDLICTNFFLDVFTEEQLEPAFTQLDAQLAPGGHWYLSDFAYPDPQHGQFYAAIGRTLVNFLYLFFAISCGLAARRLPQTESQFRKRGYRMLAEQSFLGGLLLARVYQKPDKLSEK